MCLKRLRFCLVTAAAFFVTYDCIKSLLGGGGALASPQAAPAAPATHMLAASMGEVVSQTCFSQLYLIFFSSELCYANKACRPFALLVYFP